MGKCLRNHLVGRIEIIGLRATTVSSSHAKYSSVKTLLPIDHCVPHKIHWYAYEGRIQRCKKK